MLTLSVVLGILAALADIAGGLVLVRARGVERYLRYFVALGAGFLMQRSGSFGVAAIGGYDGMCLS